MCWVNQCILLLRPASGAGERPLSLSGHQASSPPAPVLWSPGPPMEHVAADRSSFLLGVLRKGHAISSDSKPSGDNLWEVYSDGEHAKTFLIKFFSAST